MLFIRALRASALVAVVLLTGCATFPQHKVAAVQLPVATTPAQQPSAYANVQFFRGKPGAANVMELAPSLPGMDKTIAMIRSNISNAGLFRSVSFDSSTKDSADLRLNVRVYNHGDIGGGAIVGAVITGLTLYVIPSKATDTYTVQVEVNDKVGQPLAQATNVDSMNFWQGWVFLPMSGNTIQKGLEGTVGNQVRAALKDAYDSGKLSAAYQPSSIVVGN
ncbi:MAG: hypothetical protein K0S46_2479 [Moraxellaceae bacterium]|nr:hypothetical protein [Moraxellaceae bacterium]